MLKDVKWLRFSDGLAVELQQLREEGKDASSLEEAFHAVAALPAGAAKEAAARALYRQAQALPEAAGGRAEPSALEAIAAFWPEKTSKPALTEEALWDKSYGAWLGRCCGCLLGKPVESWKMPRLHEFLKDTDNFPIRGYLRSDLAEALLEKYDHEVHFRYGFINQVEGMPEDDDTNYMLIALKILERYGRGFTPADVAECWMNSLPILHVCTAERLAYRNLSMGLLPPETATYCNPCREWIGAQIRGDVFGYVNPGDPWMAAEMAWRDAGISHVKNGIYGEMWVAAMIALAFHEQDLAAVVRGGLAFVPPESRLVQAIGEVLDWHTQGLTWEEASDRIHAAWDEFNGHHWCHTISNAQVVAAALLFGRKDFAKTLAYAVMPGFDTDCNGATAGSVLGVVLGARGLPADWTEPLHDTLESGVDGMGKVKISEMARRTLRHVPCGN